jgi:AraC-like DNA-binding protein
MGNGSTLLSAPRYCEAGPPASIAKWVEAIWWIRGTVSDGIHWHDVLPDGCADWIVSADSRGVESVFVGTMTRRLPVPMQGRVNSFGSRFRPGALAGVVKAPMAEMRDCRLDTMPLPVNDGGCLTDAVADGATPHRLVKLATRLLARWHGLRGADHGAARAVRAVGMFAARHEDMTVAQIAAGAGMSVRTLRRVFDSSVGVSPKFFARVLRLQDVLAMMEAERAAMDWADVAARTGFADQAHMVREFRGFTGRTPTAWWAALKNGRFLQYGASRV